VVRGGSRKPLCLPRARKGEEEHTHRHTVKAHVEEDQRGSRLTYAEKEVVQTSKEYERENLICHSSANLFPTQDFRDFFVAKVFFLNSKCQIGEFHAG